ncbi:hypothetical protein [Actinokineospora sp.]|uniref:hypothetical protein n=1 Tax=Actinokineospora sp. TaxID=1872133 RepID=UPI00403813A9
MERHWLRGPHLRLVFAEPDAAERARARLVLYLAAHPSTVDISDAELVARAEIAGRAELVPPPYGPVYPDNTVLVVPGDRPDLAELLGEPGVRHRAALLRLGVPAVRDTVGRMADTTGDRVRHAVAAMAAHAATYPGGLAIGYQSFLSHVEDFLFRNDPGGALRAAFERQWTRNADSVCALVAAPTGPWATWSADACGLLGPAFDRGELADTPLAVYRRRAAAVGDTRDWDRVEFAEYHRGLAAAGFARVRGTREFSTYRFATNALYQLLAVCDVTPVERYLAAYLVSAAAQRLSGRTWRDLLDQAVGSAAWAD